MASAVANDFLQLCGKVVLVTGATAGLGEAIAKEFARQKCNLVLAGRDKACMEEVMSACLQLSGKEACYSLGDINEESVQKELVDAAINKFGRIDVLVNNAGTNIIGSCADVSRSDYNHVMKTNMESVFFLTQLAIPHLVKSKGSVVNISSVASERQMHKSVVYSISKAALDSFTKCLAADLAPSGVRVNAINPGTVITKIYRRGENAFSEEKIKEFELASRSSHLLNRTGLASEVADAAVYLASSRASFVTGQMLFVDGGRHIATPQPNFAKSNN